MPATPKRGRPPSDAAASHDVILNAVYRLLQTRSLRELTMEEIARQAGVGKPTLYKWWPSKAAIVMDMLDQQIAGSFEVPRAKTSEQAFRKRVSELIRLLNGFVGKVLADIIAESQSDPAALAAYRDRYMEPHRTVSRQLVKDAQASGEFKKHVEPEVLIDMIYGPLYYRLLVRHQPLDEKLGRTILNHLMAYLKNET